MAWNYTPAPVQLIHPAGTVPARPLQALDTLVWDNGARSAIIAVSESLIQVSRNGRVSCMHRAPLQGDDSQSITAVES